MILNKNVAARDEKKNLSPAFKVITVFSTYCPSGTWVEQKKTQQEKNETPRTSGKDKHIRHNIVTYKKNCNEDVLRETYKVKTYLIFFFLYETFYYEIIHGGNV